VPKSDAQKNPYIPPAMQKELEALLVEAKALAANPRIIATDEGRMIMAHFIRLEETLTLGAPLTELQKRHHA
jgi:hypothetical protein